MIDRALATVFRVITDEAASNPSFGRKLEDALAKFGRELAERRAAEQNVEGFHPHIEYRKSASEFEARLAKFDVRELRVIIDMHGLDPANTLGGRAVKKALAAHILATVQARARRDARLFEY